MSQNRSFFSEKNSHRSLILVTEGSFRVSSTSLASSRGD
jgi:hypothetical protein